MVCAWLMHKKNTSKDCDKRDNNNNNNNNNNDNNNNSNKSLFNTHKKDLSTVLHLKRIETKLIP